MATFDLEAVETDYLTYADYEEVSSVSRARLFVTAATRLLYLAAQSASNQSSSLSIDTDAIKQEKTRARAFIQANAKRSNGSSAQVSFYSVGHDFR